MPLQLDHMVLPVGELQPSIEFFSRRGAPRARLLIEIRHYDE